MIVFTPGELLPPRSLNAMLREAHEATRAATNARLAKRRENGLPAYEGPGAPLASEVPDIPPYAERPELEGVRVSVRNLRSRDLQAWQHRMGAHVAPGDADAETKAEAFGKQLDAMRGFIREAVGPVAGLVLGGSPTTLGGAQPADWTDAHLDIIETSDLVSELVTVAAHANTLSGEARGNYGASQPFTSSSPSTTATPAPSTSATSAGASAQAPSGTSRATPSRPTAAPGPSSESGPSSATSSLSMPTAEANSAQA